MSLPSHPNNNNNNTNNTTTTYNSKDNVSKSTKDIDISNIQQEDISKIIEENKKLKMELKAFDTEFFEEIEDLKYNYSKLKVQLHNYYLIYICIILYILIMLCCVM
jgi:hypothetical protein